MGFFVVVALTFIVFL